MIDSVCVCVSIMLCYVIRFENERSLPLGECRSHRLVVRVGEHAEHVVVNEDLAACGGPGADPDGGNFERLGDGRGEL